MKLELSVEGNDGLKRVATAEFADFVKFEEVHNISMAKIEESLKVRDLAWLAWHSEKRRNKTALGFDDWCATIVSINIEMGGSEIAPLESPQPTG